MVQVSALPLRYGRQSYTVRVGAAPNFTYMSASPVPPDIVNVRLLEPAGTARLKYFLPLIASESPVTATPLVSTVVPEVVTVRLTGVLWVVLPPVPVTVLVDVPAVA